MTHWFFYLKEACFMTAKRGLSSHSGKVWSGIKIKHSRISLASRKHPNYCQIWNQHHQLITETDDNHSDTWQDASEPHQNCSQVPNSPTGVWLEALLQSQTAVFIRQYKISPFNLNSKIIFENKSSGGWLKNYKDHHTARVEGSQL